MPLKLEGWVRILVESCQRLEKWYLGPVQPYARCKWMGAREALHAVLQLAFTMQCSIHYGCAPWCKVSIDRDLQSAHHSKHKNEYNEGYLLSYFLIMKMFIKLDEAACCLEQTFL